MEDWQFLLQKEGDRCWLPVKMPLLEIEEGKYRILASGDRANEDLEIHLAHQAYPQDKSPRCYQKRFRRTNPAGLVVIIPLTYLTPGLWKLSCGGDLLSELVGKPWQKSLNLEVLPKIGTGEQEDNQTSRQEVEQGRPTPALPGGSRQRAEGKGFRQRSVGSVGAETFHGTSLLGSVGVILSPLSPLPLDPAYLRCSSPWSPRCVYLSPAGGQNQITSKSLFRSSDCLQTRSKFGISEETSSSKKLFCRLFSN